MQSAEPVLLRTDPAWCRISGVPNSLKLEAPRASKKNLAESGLSWGRGAASQPRPPSDHCDRRFPGLGRIVSETGRCAGCLPNGCTREE